MTRRFEGFHATLRHDIGLDGWKVTHGPDGPDVPSLAWIEDSEAATCRLTNRALQSAASAMVPILWLRREVRWANEVDRVCHEHPPKRRRTARKEVKNA